MVFVLRLNNVNVIELKWVYHIKYSEDGTIDRYKTRLVAKGFTQIPKLNYSPYTWNCCKLKMAYQASRCSQHFSS